MTLQNLAYLAEIVGVFGLIASLIYVGRQVQQNTVQMRVAASSERLGIEGERMIDVTNTVSLAFFEAYMRDGPKPRFDNGRFPELTVETNM